ncbi:MAG: gliding motility-associated C-terminal domain-containing protein [Ferruginibacter sp.]
MRLVTILAVAFACTLLSLASFCQVQINSIQTTVSTCANNGTITVDAISPAPPLLYRITAGPVTAPLQTNNVFNSLPTGTYTVKVSDAAGNNMEQEAIIPGNYLQPDFNPTKKDPYCPGGSDGQLVGNVITGTGTGPYTWQLIAPSPVTTAPQSSDTFDNLPAGNYTMRLTDACGGFRTIVVTLTDPAPSNIRFSTSPRITMIGCDTAFVVMYMYADVERYPLTVQYGTNAGIINVPDAPIYDTANNYPGYFTLTQVLPNFSYGEPMSVMITDPCGVTVMLPLYYAQPFYFCYGFLSDFSNCTDHTMAYFDLNLPSCTWQYEMMTHINPPLIYDVTAASTGSIVAADTLYGSPDGYGYSLVSGLLLPSLPTNESYTINIHDKCGRTFTETFFIADPVFLDPVVSGKSIYKDACTDSAAFCFFQVDNFRSEPKLIFLSGPPYMGSTKPGYQYSATYSYPDTIPIGGIGPLTYRFDISDLSVGTYQVKIFDTCGFALYDSIVVEPTSVTDFGHHFWYKKGCLGRNELHYIVNSGVGSMKIRNISAGTEIIRDYYNGNSSGPILDSLLNVPSGTYVLTFEYGRNFGATTPVEHTPTTCQSLTDTVIIEGYQTPAVFANNYIQCQSGIHVEIIPDSSKGVPPYQYEIISGPQTFPVQTSNVFDLITAGTYTVRIYDICGNASTSQITVDPIIFPPVAVMPFSCNSTSLSYGSSQYYTYQWIAPNGTVYIGDTLTINPVTPADTGIYTIIKIVNIDGCTDTFYTTHHVPLYNTNILTVSICNGSSITFGTHTYDSTGIYTDTLTNINNCDSIVVLNLTVELFKKDSITRVICAGETYSSGGHVYNQTGIYHDTLTTATCDSIAILNLTVLPVITHSITRSICSGESYTVGTHSYNQTGIYHDTLSTATCDSIVVLDLTVVPLITHSITQSICLGDSYSVGVHIYNQTGIYHDTLSTASCDSIVILNLTVDPFKTHSITQSICSGESYSVGIHTYNQTGVYHDTLTTATCDSIVTLNLTVNALITHSIAQSICSGESYTIGTHSYNQTGIYHDTLSTATCDSVVILNLTVNPLITHSITQSICSGESYTIGTHSYNQTGIYHDTLSTATCDSIVILDLTVIPLITHSITQSICSGESYTIGTHSYNQTGIYHDTLSTATCDSIVILNLTVNPLITHSITQSICSGESYTVGTHSYNQTGIYHDTLSTAACDSVVILNLTVNPLITHSITQSICWGESYTVGTHSYNQTGIYHDTLSTVSCDSIVILDLTVLPQITHSISQSVCAGSSYTVGTHTYDQTGIYHDTLSTATCDSVVILNLIVTPLATHSITDSICGGQVYVFNGHTYTQSGYYTDTLHTAGCDSTVTLNLTVIPITSVQISASAYTVIPGDMIQLNATVSPSYLWTSTAGASIGNTGIQNPTAVINNAAWIYLNTNAGPCASGDSLYIMVNRDSTPCSGTYIYMPSAFTPNQDGLNDVFKVLANKIHLNVFRIYNRWGEEVFYTTDINKGWDGTYKGKLIPGSYVYMVSYYTTCDPRARLMKGNIVLIQ